MPRVHQAIKNHRADLVQRGNAKIDDETSPTSEQQDFWKLIIAEILRKFDLKTTVHGGPVDRKEKRFRFGLNVTHVDTIVARIVRAG